MSIQNQSTSTSHKDDGTGVVLRYTEPAGPSESKMVNAHQAEQVLGFLLRNGIDAVMVDTSAEPVEVVGGVDVELRHWWFDGDVFKQEVQG